MIKLFNCFLTKKSENCQFSIKIFIKKLDLAGNILYTYAMKIIIQNANVTLGNKEILENINFEINDGEKIAVIGRNGCGKSTLLRLIMGEIEPDSSESKEEKIKIIGKPTIGELKQISFDDETTTLQDEINKIFKPILKQKEKLELLQKKLEEDPTEKAFDDYVTAEHNYDIMGGYTYLKQYNEAYKKFGFSKEDETKKISEFSGGQKTRIALIKLLFSTPDVLILDEPTNHLDLDAIKWLEDYLIAYKKAVVVVSHDRAFLDRVAKIVYEIENKTAKKYIGNYSAFLETKKKQREAQQAEYDRYTNEVKRLNTLVDRFRYKATKASMAQSKIKAIERMEKVEAPTKEDTSAFHFKLKVDTPSGLEVIRFEKLKYGYNGVSLGELSANLYKGDKVFIVGGNGLGKSTILKTVMGFIPPIAGKIKIGMNVSIGYFDQQTITTSVKNETILDSYLSEFSDLSTEQARTILGAFLFTGEDVFKEIPVLSGGERVRLELAKIFSRKPNLLILDEPTNHMDIAGKIALENILKEYDGTLICVSHDRYFINQLATGIIELKPSQVTYFKNTTYSEYIEKKNKADKPITLDFAMAPEKPAKQNKPNEYKQNKEKVKLLAKLERDIEKHENTIKELKDQYYSPENCSNAELLMELEQKIKTNETELEKLMEEWILVKE